MSLFTPAELRLYATLSEKKLWEYLRAHRCGGHKFRRQHQISRTIVDFVCLRKKLIVEVDGAVHDKQKEYDQRQDTWLESRGYTVLRFSNDDVELRVDQVVETIRRALGSLTVR